VNLILDPWIPVVMDDGSANQVGLEKFYSKAHEIRDLSVSPPQRVSLMRLFLCITQAALDGPDDEADWEQCKEDIVPMSIDYLSTRVELFELYGKAPFLQVGGLKHKHNATCDKLCFTLRAGNNHTLFDQAACPEGRDHSDAWLTLNLLTYQCFSTGGTIGVTYWAGQQTSPKNPGMSKDAPCITVSALHTVLKGKSMLDTLYLNLITKEQISVLPNSSWGKPLWDDFPTSQTSKAVKQLTTSYLGRLVPLTRAILLEEGKKTCTLCDGLYYPPMPDSRIPTATIIEVGKDNTPRYVSTNLAQHPWRDLAAILSSNRVDGKGGTLALEHLNAKVNGPLAFWVGGQVRDRSKYIDMAEWTFKLTDASQFTNVDIARYRLGVEKANEGEKSLCSAVYTYGGQMNVGKPRTKAFFERAKSCYWSALSSGYHVLLEAALDPGLSLKDWYEALRNTMREAYRGACPVANARQIEAFAKGRKKLWLSHFKKGD